MHNFWLDNPPVPSAIGLWLTPDEIWSYLVMQHAPDQKPDETRSVTYTGTCSDHICSYSVSLK